MVVVAGIVVRRTMVVECPPDRGSVVVGGGGRCVPLLGGVNDGVVVAYCLHVTNNIVMLFLNLLFIVHMKHTHAK